MQTRPTFLRASICTLLALGVTMVPAFAGPELTAAPSKAVVEPAGNPLCFASDTFCIDLQERARLEVRDNNFDFNRALVSKTDDTWLLQRFRLGVLWKPTSWLRFYAQGQDVREFESKRPNIPGAMGAEGDDNFDLRQAYVEVGPFDGFTLKAGRQILAFGDERLVGSTDWNNFSRTFDAARLTYKDQSFQLDLFTSSVVVIQRDQFDKSDLFNGNETHREQVFSGAYLSTDRAPWGSAEAYFFWLDQSNGNASNLSGLLAVAPATGSLSAHTSFGTYGFRLKGDPAKLHDFEFEVEAAYQNGTVRGLDLSAAAVHAGLGYNFSDLPLKPRLWAEYNYATGDSDSTDGDVGTFQNLFPTNHKFYGIMDLFAWQNMQNAALSFRVSPAKAVTAQLDYRAAFLATNEDVWYRSNTVTAVRPLNAAARDASKFLGQELDFILTWNVNPHVNVQAGYAHFFAGSYLADTGASDDADFGYLMTTFTF